MFLLCLFLWVQRRIAKSIERIKSYSLSHSFETLKPTKTKYIHYGDIHTGKLSNITDLRMLPFIPEGDYESLQKGDLILADASEDYRGIGDICILNVENTEYNVVSGLHTIALRPKNDFPFFLYTLFKLESFKHYGYKMGTGLKVFGITYNSIGKYQFFKPSFEEQRKVSHLIVNIDHLITLQQLKIDQLNKVKKALLQQMFPEQDSKIPKTRFSRFTDPWEQRKLGEFIIEYNEKTTLNNQYPVLTSSRKGLFLQKDYFSGNQIASIDNTGYNVVPYGYFTYRHMSDDNIFWFNINTLVRKGIVSTLYPVFTTNAELDSQYLQLQLNFGDEFARYALLQKQGGSRTYMYLKKLKQLRLTIPKTLDEQETISYFFDCFDSLIALHQRKLDQLKQVKKFLLQNMFI